MKERREQERRFSMDSENPEQCIRRAECRHISKNVTAGRRPGPGSTKGAVAQMAQCRLIGTDFGGNLIKRCLFQSRIKHG